MREEYGRGKLNKSDLLTNPFDQFSQWFETARQEEVYEANAMTLSTVSSEGHPSSRIILLKGMDERSLHFYSNYDSRKGKEMLGNPNVSVVFFWKELQRQLRVDGRVEKMTFEESEKYFQGRPTKSQQGAWASAQSQEIENRDILEARVKEVQERFAGLEKLPCPPNWGGYRILPVRFEFWQGRESRLHDRFQYRKVDDNWEIVRLSP